MSRIIESAIEWAVNIANDPSHGYDQINRWGPNYDCSSLAISAYEVAGLPIRENGGSYTGNMKAAFTKCGFKAIPYKKGMATWKKWLTAIIFLAIIGAVAYIIYDKGLF